MITVITPKRHKDKWGSGEYGASRGDRKHNGVDYLAATGSIVCSLTAGIVTKLGYPYSDDLSYRYVEVKDGLGNRWRYFYVQPSVKEGHHLSRECPIGEVQDLTKRYTGIGNHIHLEVINAKGEYVNPEEVKLIR